VRVLSGAAPGFTDVHGFQHLERALPGVPAREAAVHPRHFAELIDNAHIGVQRRHRILEDHRDARAANLIQPLKRHAD